MNQGPDAGPDRPGDISKDAPVNKPASPPDNPSAADIILAGLKSIPFANRRFLSVIAVVAVLAYLLSGIYVVQTDELGVVMRFGKVIADNVPPGIHYSVPWPVDRVYRPKTAEIKKMLVGLGKEGESSTVGGLETLTGDTNVILVQVIIQYAISDPKSYLFTSDNPTRLVEVASEEVVAAVVGSMGVDALLTTEKLQAQALIKAGVQKVADEYGIGVTVIGAYFQDISPPVEVAYAFRDVASAREDRSRLVNEAEGYKNTIIPATRGKAISMVREAEAYRDERVEMARGEAERFLSLLEEYSRNREVTASRIYIEKMEKILPNLKVYMVDRSGEDGTANLRLILPTQKR
ncbi:MAG: FtsH protease activity modulator HflK [bacterium]|jgi:membrane protease subunit HflK